MILFIDTTQRDRLLLRLLSGGECLRERQKFVAGLSENLLVEIQKFLRRSRIKPRQLGKIMVNPGPGGFSSTRTGVATANALALAWQLPVAEYPSGERRNLVLPKYDHAPHITKPNA